MGVRDGRRIAVQPVGSAAPALIVAALLASGPAFADDTPPDAPPDEPVPVPSDAPPPPDEPSEPAPAANQPPAPTPEPEPAKKLRIRDSLPKVHVDRAPPPISAGGSCTGTSSSGQRFPICFDPGNRLWASGGTNGVAAGIALRHVIRFDDDPNLIWKLSHALGEVAYGGMSDRYAATLYSGRFVRHSRDGHIVLPFGSLRKVFLPFDIGVDAEVGRLDGKIGAPTASLEVVRTAALIDLSRSEDFRQRFAIGPVGRWDVAVARNAFGIDEHVVSPFSLAAANLHLESNDGITIADVSVEGGTAWHNATGWKSVVRGEASLERTVLSINDRPVALVVGARYDAAELLGQVAARFVLIHRRDPRVSLRH
jgi:hypothetical protein